MPAHRELYSRLRRGKSTTPQGIRHVQYQALTYTWGEPVFTKTLHVLNGTDAAGDTNITENLHSALQNLREPDKILVLWVDAVCIDQSNTSERSSQVSNIPQTYSEASAVLIWLGTDSLQNDGQLCLDFFSRLARHISSGPCLSERPDQGSWRRRFKINQMVTTFLDSTKPRVIASFLTRPWFRRRWIIQEVVLARDISIHCGASSIPWTTFELSLTELFDNDKGGFSDEHRTTLRTMSRIRHADSGAKSQAPLDTLIEFSSFECSDPRDRLYALYGVIQHWLPGSPDEVQTGSVDYASSVEAVYTNFALLLMHLNHSKSFGRSLQFPYPRTAAGSCTQTRREPSARRELREDSYVGAGLDRYSVLQVSESFTARSRRIVRRTCQTN